MTGRIVLGAIATLCLAAPPSLAQAPEAAKTKSTPVAPVDETRLPDVVAKVNGVDIRKIDLQNAVETMKMQLEMIGQAMPPDRKDEIWRGLLDEIIATELLSQEATTRKIAVTEADVDGEVTRFRERFPSETVFQNFLKEQGFSEKQIREEIRKQLGIKKMLDKEVFAKVAVDEKAAREYFEKNPEMFQEPEAVRAAHVLVKVDKDADARTRAEAKKEAEKVLADAKAGKDFGELAREHSDDPGSRSKGGDLDFFVKGQMVPPFEEAAFGLQKPGDLSGVVETVYGYHVIKLTERKPARSVPFSEVKDDLVDFLKEKKKSDQLRAYVDGLRKRAKVQIFI